MPRMNLQQGIDALKAKIPGESFKAEQRVWVWDGIGSAAEMKFYVFRPLTSRHYEGRAFEDILDEMTAHMKDEILELTTYPLSSYSTSGILEVPCQQ